MEAAILFPAFLSIIMLFLLFFQLIVLESAIQTAANETVKQLAVAISPFEAELRKSDETVDKLNLDQLDFMPNSVRQWLRSFEELEELPDQALQLALRDGLKTIVWSHIPQTMRNTLVKEDQLKVSRVIVPYLFGDQQLFGVQLRYNVQISLPFYQREISIVKQAQERVWFGL